MYITIPEYVHPYQYNEVVIDTSAVVCMSRSVIIYTPRTVHPLYEGATFLPALLDEISCFRTTWLENMAALPSSQNTNSPFFERGNHFHFRSLRKLEDTHVYT